MQAAPLDSLAPDTTAADSALVDTTQGIGALTSEIGEATQAIAHGQFEVAFDRITGAFWTFLTDNLLPALLVAIAFWVAHRIVQNLLRRALGRSRRIDTGVQQLILRFTRFVMLSVAGIAVLDEVGIAIAPFLAGLGIAGLAIGFAAQDTVQNLIAGVTILLDRPFQVGDNIELHDTFGTVEEITLRTTRVRTLDNQMAILPNANVITERIINHSMLRALRVVVPFGIAYKESPAEARAVVLALAEGDARLHPDYLPAAVVTDLGDSSVNMELRLHLKDAQLEVPLRLEYQEKVFDALKAAGIEIPFPHLQLFVDEAKAFQGSRLLGPGPDGVEDGE